MLVYLLLDKLISHLPAVRYQHVMFSGESVLTTPLLFQTRYEGHRREIESLV